MRRDAGSLNVAIYLWSAIVTGRETGNWNKQYMKPLNHKFDRSHLINNFSLFFLFFFHFYHIHSCQTQVITEAHNLRLPAMLFCYCTYISWRNYVREHFSNSCSVKCHRNKKKTSCQPVKTMALLGLERADHLLSTPSLHVLTFNGAIAQASPRSRSPARHTPLRPRKLTCSALQRSDPALSKHSCVFTTLIVHGKEVSQKECVPCCQVAAATKGACFLLLRCARRVS